MSKKSELIFIPTPGIGHLASSLEFAKNLINRNTNLHITILCIKFPNTPFSDSYIKTFLHSQPQIKLIDLPQVEPPPHHVLLKSPEFYILTFMESLIPHVRTTMQNILASTLNHVVGVFLDFFCVSMIDVGDELGIPSYLFITSNVGFLGFMLSLVKNREIQHVFNGSDSDSDHDVFIPGFSKLVPIRVLPDACFNKDGGYFSYYKLAERFRDTKGIIVNSFYELEKNAIDALCNDQTTPPIYAVGPLLDLKGQPNPNLEKSQHDGILKWLDEQPNSSVVFLCFGSMGSFGPSQTREIAIALKGSGVRFLWAMRTPPNNAEGDLALPEGFLEWMNNGNGKGMICEWAPQVEVLGHKAIGGFVSHCGWNSILESMWFGVPILTWPIYAEQQLNAFWMVKEWELGVELRMDYRRGSDVVMAEEIEKGLKKLMERDNKVYKKVQEIKEVARKAVSSGGSSFVSIGKLIDDMIGNN